MRKEEPFANKARCVLPFETCQDADMPHMDMRTRLAWFPTRPIYNLQALALLVCTVLLKPRISTARSLPVSVCVPALSLSRARARGRASLLSTKSDVPRPIWMWGAFGDYPHEVCRRAGMEVSHPLIVDHATSSACVPPSVRAILAAGVAARPPLGWPWSSLSADLMWWCLISCGVCGELAGLRPALL